jgi:hypothetical protein
MEYLYSVLQNRCTELAVQFVIPSEHITMDQCEVHVCCI